MLDDASLAVPVRIYWPPAVRPHPHLQTYTASGRIRRAMRHKIHPSLDSAVADIRDGARIMFGGFGGAGFPNNLIQALAAKGVKEITAISNNCGTRDGELGLMFKNGQIRHVIASFPGPHSNYFQEQLSAKK